MAQRAAWPRGEAWPRGQAPRPGVASTLTQAPLYAHIDVDINVSAVQRRRLLFGTPCLASACLARAVPSRAPLRLL